MSGNIHTTAFIFNEQTMQEGHRLGSIIIDDSLFLHFMEDDPIPQLEKLRDECHRQIVEIAKANVARKAGQTGPSIYPVTLPPNAPAEQLAVPWIPAAPPLEGEPIPLPPVSELAESIRASEEQWIQGRADGREPIDYVTAAPEEKVIVTDDFPDVPF